MMKQETLKGVNIKTTDHEETKEVVKYFGLKIATNIRAGAPRGGDSAKSGALSTGSSRNCQCDDD